MGHIADLRAGRTVGSDPAKSPRSADSLRKADEQVTLNPPSLPFALPFQFSLISSEVAFTFPLQFAFAFPFHFSSLSLVHCQFLPLGRHESGW